MPCALCTGSQRLNRWLSFEDVDFPLRPFQKERAPGHRDATVWGGRGRCCPWRRFLPKGRGKAKPRGREAHRAPLSKPGKDAPSSRWPPRRTPSCSERPEPQGSHLRQLGTASRAGAGKRTQFRRRHRDFVTARDPPEGERPRPPCDHHLQPVPKRSRRPGRKRPPACCLSVGLAFAFASKRIPDSALARQAPLPGGLTPRSRII